MSLEELYEELGVARTSEEQDMFFNDLIDAAVNASEHLGGAKRKKTKYRESLVNEIQQMQQEVKACTAEFSPVLEVNPLSEEKFRSRGFEVPPDIAEQFKNYRYALVNIPIMLVPVKGWGFTRLDCIAAFNPDRPLNQRPLAHQLFPGEEWQEKIKFSQQLSVGVDEFLNFKAVGTVPPVASAGVGADVHGGFQLVLGPYNYSIRLPRVTARGVGNVKVRWTLEGEENVQQNELKLGVVLKVPRQAKKVELVGVMTLSRKFHTFSTDVKYLVEYIRTRSKDFFRRGTPPRLPPGVWDITEKLQEV
jgi:hypothetical protein